MPAARISIRKIKEVLRLRFDAVLSIRQISSAVKLSTGDSQTGGIIRTAMAGAGRSRVVLLF